ncbi:MAG TPA: hypothetical protein VNE39_11430 [Planctomycetota bacterium]|nr:hypothetical protein [Planctomycetota bacterium]
MNGLCSRIPIGWVRALSGVVSAAFQAAALAGFWALPLGAEIDRADAVVLGKLVRATPSRTDHDGQMITSRGTISVRETLKGEAAKEVTITLVTALAWEAARQMQSPPRIYRVGDEGIWVIVEGRPSHGYGVLPENRAQEVRDTVARLARREWSQPVSGLRCWAALVKETEVALARPPHLPRLIFAVQNVSKDTLYLPLAIYSNVLAAYAQDKEGNRHEIKGAGAQHEGKAPLHCLPLGAGGTRYMHPDGENYGYFVIPSTLPPGEYQIFVSFGNALDGRMYNDEPAQAWKGRLTAPPLRLTIPPRVPAPRPAP